MNVPHSPGPSTGSGQAPGKRILLADDSPQIRECLAILLNQAGYETIQVADGREALDELERHPFDLLMLDLNMPEVDGWTALEQLAGRHPNLSIIVITAQANQREWVRNLGAMALLEKPLDLPLLFQTILDLTGDSSAASTATAPAGFRYGRPRRSPATTQRIVTSGINE